MPLPVAEQIRLDSLEEGIDSAFPPKLRIESVSSQLERLLPLSLNGQLFKFEKFPRELSTNFYQLKRGPILRVGNMRNETAGQPAQRAVCEEIDHRTVIDRKVDIDDIAA